MFIYTDTRIYVYAQTRVAPGDDPTHFNQNAAPPESTKSRNSNLSE